MWCAKGGCFRRLDRKQDAIKSYERALGNNDREGIATIKLAKLYEEEGEETKAAHCYNRHLEQHDTVEIESEGDVEALLFLARYYKNRRQLQLAAQHCSRLLDYNGPEKEEAKAMLREIRTLESEDNEFLSTSHVSATSQDNSLFSP
jgi:anaphase-promoting complex subunit 8